MDDAQHRLTGRINELKHNNKQLNKSHSQLKAKVLDFTQQLDELKQRDGERSESFLCVNRLWEQLNDELQHLAARLDLQLDTEEPSDAEVAEVTAAVQAITDPYLRRLLVGDPSSIRAVKKAHVTLEGGLSDAEKALKERSKATAEAFARVLEAVQQQRQYSSSLAAQIASSEADAALKEENQRLAAEVVRLQQQLDGSHAKALSTSQLLKDRESQLTTANNQQQAAENALADKEMQLYLLHGKFGELQHKVEQAEAEVAAAKAAAAAAKVAAAAAVPSPSGEAQAADPGVKADPDAAAEPSSAAADPGAAAEPSSAAAAPEADPAAALPPDIQEQLADLQRLCDKRAVELETERVEHLKTKQLLEAAKSRGTDESWVPSTSMWNNQRVQLTRLHEQLEERRKEVEKAVADRDAMLTAMSNHHTQKETIASLQKKVEAQVQQVQSMNQTQMELMQQADAAKQALAARVAAEGQPSTKEMLSKMINALQKEVEQKDKALHKNKVAGETVDSSVMQLAAARGQAEAARAQVALLQQRLRDKTATMLGGAAREASLQERVVDLQVFVDVLTTYTSDPRDVVEVRKSEREMAVRLKALEKAQQTHELQQKLAAATAVERELRVQLDEAAVSADALAGEVAGLKQQVADLEGQVAAVRKDAEYYIQDINQAQAAYEEMQQQNTQLLQQLSTCDTALTELQTAKQLVEQQLYGVQQQHKQGQAALERLKGELAGLQGVRDALEKDLAKTMAELAQAKDAVRVQTAKVNEVSVQLQSEKAKSADLNVILERERDLHGTAQKRAAEEAETAAREQFKRQKLMEEHEVLQEQLARLRKVEDRDEALQDAEARYEKLRLMTKCSICKVHPMNAMLKHCNHVFCKGCLENQCQGRNRKCPGCGSKFGKDDIVDLYLGFDQ